MYNKGKNNPMYGRHHSDETKLKIGKAHLGHKYNLGRKFSEEHKQKLSEANKGNKNALGHKHSEGAKQKISESKRGKKNFNFGEIVHMAKLGKMSTYERWKINRSSGIKRKYYKIIYWIKTKLNMW